MGRSKAKSGQWWWCPHSGCQGWEWQGTSACRICRCPAPDVLRNSQQAAETGNASPALKRRKAAETFSAQPRADAAWPQEPGQPADSQEDLRSRIQAAERVLKTMTGPGWERPRQALAQSIQDWRHQLQEAQPTGARLRGLQEGRERRLAKVQRLRQAQAETVAELDSLDQKCELEVLQVRERFSQRAEQLQQEMHSRAADLAELQKELTELSAQQAQLVAKESQEAAAQQGPNTGLEAALVALQSALRQHGPSDPTRAERCQDTLMLLAHHLDDANIRPKRGREAEEAATDAAAEAAPAPPPQDTPPGGPLGDTPDAPMASSAVRG